MKKSLLNDRVIYMFKTLRNKKGMTLTEVIIALAVLGIISVPLIAVFSNSVFITRLTKNQLEINAVIQIVKVEVTQAVKMEIRLRLLRILMIKWKSVLRSLRRRRCTLYPEMRQLFC